MRLFLALLIAVFSALSQPAAWSQNDSGDWPSFGVFDSSDYEKYFTKGAYLSKYVDGEDQPNRWDILQIEFADEDGSLSMHMDSLYTMRAKNYWRVGEQQYSKSIQRLPDAYWIWNADGRFFTQHITHATWINNLKTHSKVWLSDNDDLLVSPDDEFIGSMYDYFVKGLEGIGQPCCESIEKLQDMFSGEIRFQCNFLSVDGYEVMCRIDRNRSGIVEHFLYKKLADGGV